MLELGQAAPDFELKDQHGQDVCLSDYASAKNVVLVFYPFAFSRVCTGELGEIRDQFEDFATSSTALLAISCDSKFSLRAYAEQEVLPFPLLSDFWPHGVVSSAYGVFNARLGCSGRATFMIDRSGALRWQVENEIPQARNLEDYRNALAEMA